MKVGKVFDQNNEIIPGYFVFDCPGCKCSHWFTSKDYTRGIIHWDFNGNMEKPTVNPSILVNRGGVNVNMPICHSFIKDGFIQFLNDCTHHLAGQTVELPELT